MTPTCPRCQSSHVAARNHARKTAGTIGAVAGAASSFSTAMKGAQMGQRLGLLGGPAGMAMGTIAGAILGGLLGGAAGCSAGIALGGLIDDNVLANYCCLECSYTFGHVSARLATTPSSFATAHTTHAMAEDQWFNAFDGDELLSDAHT
jgi:hypothetical protein